MTTARVTKKERKHKGDGSLYKSKDGYWYFTYGSTINGEHRKKKKVFRSGDCITEVASGKVNTSAVDAVTCQELLDESIEHLRLQKKASAYVIEKCINAHGKPFFGKRNVVALTTGVFKEYRSLRKAGGVIDSTVDHDMTYLPAALNLEHEKKPPHSFSRSVDDP